MPCRNPGGVVSQDALQVSRPTPKEEAKGSGLGGSVSRPTPRGVSRPTPSGVWNAFLFDFAFASA